VGFQAGSTGGRFEGQAGSAIRLPARSHHIGVCSTRLGLLNLFPNGNIRVINMPDNA
jgi:hypothetical protein